MTGRQAGAPGVLRPYDKSSDLAAIKRMWREVGWVDSDEQAALIEPFFEAGRSLVYEQDGSAESTCHITRGRVRYQDHDLVMAAVTAVTTSYVARKQGAARRLLARMLAEEAQTGAQVSALGIFDQGFYDTLGYGTGSYDHRFEFDPSTLLVDRPFRIPSRLGAEDYEEVHACMAARQRGHGGLTLDDAKLVKAEFGWIDKPFGLGYRDDDGTLTHFVIGNATDENGPYKVHALAYQDVDQLLELLAMFKGLSDQVHTIEMTEPQHLQFQDVLRQPFRDAYKVRKTAFHKSVAWWQVRILDLPTCIEVASFPGDDLTFNLQITDPAVEHLPEGIDWAGVTGDYVVTFGLKSTCLPGRDPDLPTLRAGVGSFSRLWFGVREASALAATTDLDGEASLLARLDDKIRLPRPVMGWDF